jgi:ferritin-like metal-binding protein YciE
MVDKVASWGQIEHLATPEQQETHRESRATLAQTGDSMQTNRLKHLYIEELKDLYSAENQLVKALPKMAKASTSEDLREGFEEHLEQTKEHVARLEKIFKSIGESPKGKKCKGMEGLIKEGAEMIEEDPEPEELDAGLISAAQRVEHYEMAGYGCVSTYAKLLGDDHAVSLLRQTLDEEKDADRKLTQLSSRINLEAANSESDATVPRTKKAAAGR